MTALRHHVLLLAAFLTTLSGAVQLAEAAVIADVHVITGTMRKGLRPDARLARFRRTFRKKFTTFKSFYLERRVTVRLVRRVRTPVALEAGRILYLTNLGPTKRLFIRLSMELLPIFRTALRIRNGGTFMYALDKRKKRQILIIAVTLRNR